MNNYSHRRRTNYPSTVPPPSPGYDPVPAQSSASSSAFDSSIDTTTPFILMEDSLQVDQFRYANPHQRHMKMCLSGGTLMIAFDEKVIEFHSYIVQTARRQIRGVDLNNCSDIADCLMKYVDAFVNTLTGNISRRPIQIDGGMLIVV